MANLVKQELSSAWSRERLAHLNELCSTLLTALENIPGFQVAFICDNHGKIVGALSTTTFDRGLYNTIGANIAQTFAAFQSRSGCKDLELRFEQRTLFARDMGNAFVAVLMAAGASLSLLRMTLNVSAGTFESDANLQTSLKNAASSRAGALSQNSMNVLTWQLVQKANLVKAG